MALQIYIYSVAYVNNSVTFYFNKTLQNLRMRLIFDILTEV